MSAEDNGAKSKTYMKTEQTEQPGGKAALHSRARHSFLHGVIWVYKSIWGLSWRSSLVL